MAPENTEKSKLLTESTVNGEDKLSSLPTWINEENFQSVFEENIPGYRKTLSFEVKETGGGGENYASMMMRVKAKVELKDGSTKDIAFMIKTTPQGEQGAAMVTMMGLFPKETAMYGKYLLEFEKMYRSVGKEVTFGPKFYKLKNDPGVEYVLLEDISPRGFKNVNRQNGLDMDHTNSVLKILAQLHAVSAVRYELKGDYEESFMKSPFNEDSRESLDAMMKPMIKVIKECYAKHETGIKYLPKLELLFDKMIEKFIDENKLNLNEFNVIVHGDLWSNNIMFRHNDEGKREETILIDYQMSRFATPVVDLFYFLLSSPSLDIKVSCFDEFIQFYYDNLVENLKLLNYPKKLPTLKQLRMDLLKYSSFGVSTLTGILAAILLDPTENANIDNFLEENTEATDFKTKLYDNPRYIKHLEVILPWMDKMGYLDES
ncbi:uncharacterized protein LOC129919605 [Episyrphus balteatus]|uniref:uncharacterized protein LOC129919605 n=1 Tax=Episyrphus balteatus TaxID=286459 RepID=UPI002485E25D|nr:uncharacterized protein LOC129919605 [Episyrphus balteatus]XP_055856521.1 uncharacterized protein LOC129919605 [Episyrphus balteatus]XP_055856522.1 uncharacterized protein LOC129919605 [Episyrphus balteatus]XP_055856523.1 uncharacterized protein LOC129919605 [Episyrphus balteatus]